MPVTESVLYEQRGFPIFQNRMYDSESEACACPRGDILLVQDKASGLVYNAAFRPELMRYDRHYQNEQAVSAVFKRHLEQVTAIIERYLGCRDIVEVGCGKGYFLERLLSAGIDARGFDPAYEGDNPRIDRCPFDPAVGLTGKGLVLRHVLEHIQSPFDFLAQLRVANGGNGLIYIEVPCLDWILMRRAWFDIFYEHVNYFRLSDFQRLFADICAAGHLFGGQYLYVVAALESLRKPVMRDDDPPCFPDDFLGTLVGSRQQAAGSRQQAAGSRSASGAVHPRELSFRCCANVWASRLMS